jgi:hypothetical protein
VLAIRRQEHAHPIVFVINRVGRLIVKRKGMEINVSSGHEPALLVDVLLSSRASEARL